jgi:hypothetical protein
MKLFTRSYRPCNSCSLLQPGGVSAPGSRHGRQPSPPSIESKPRKGRHREGDIAAVFVATGIAAMAPVALFGLGKLEKRRRVVNEDVLGGAARHGPGADAARLTSVAPSGLGTPARRQAGLGNPRAAKRGKSRMIPQPCQGRLFITAASPSRRLSVWRSPLAVPAPLARKFPDAVLRYIEKPPRVQRDSPRRAVPSGGRGSLNAPRRADAKNPVAELN